MKQKSKLKSTKGYMQIDIAFAILIFFMLFITLHTINKDNINGHEEQYQQNKLLMDARDICYQLTATSGQPNNWENSPISDSVFLGLKNKTSNKLDKNKIIKFNSSSYYNITDKFNTSNYINIRINGIETNNTYLNIDAKTQNKAVKRGNYVCYSNYNSEIVEVIIETWK
jgi:hypothetical protein